MRTYARDLATGAAALVLAADPAVLVLGGDLSLSSDLWLEHFTRALERLVFHMPSIRVSTIGDDAVVRGAARRATLDVRDRYFGDYLLPAPIAPTSSTS